MKAGLTRAPQDHRVFLTPLAKPLILPSKDFIFPAIGQLHDRLRETVAKPKLAAIGKFREEGNEKAVKRLEKQQERQLAEIEKLLS